ncbi:CheY chemotaxis protein or a CheY-like REC [Nostoc flagelliforme CCNUN1]|uniref:CheY chemotaxis protein or a CheY-like REC n=1 Tax=Nostoc flagelliforme CCNUN1 TaxID=2038116 RepID=A0A2K8T4V5_9NOSO|nr:CheY chemotaxis protein or a CheY-like REC [Nostoc flagelliforme CCNUN1]
MLAFNLRTSVQCPMPHAQCPMPNAQCPMPHAQCPMPNALNQEIRTFS